MLFPGSRVRLLHGLLTHKVQQRVLPLLQQGQPVRFAQLVSGPPKNRIGFNKKVKMFSLMLIGIGGLPLTCLCSIKRFRRKDEDDDDGDTE